MKIATTFIVVFVGLLSYTANAQETIWFDANWQETSEDKAKYYRPVPKKTKEGFWIIDYYDNGQIQMEGYSTVNKPGEEEFDGLVVYYHPNGNFFHKANYKNGKLHGVRMVYYETGNLKEQGSYVEGKRQGNWKIFYENGKIKEKGKYENSEKVGVWKTFYKNL